MATSALAESSAMGSLILNDAIHPISHVTAVRVPSSFAHRALVTRVVLSDLPVPSTAVRETAAMMALRQKGGLHAVMLEFSDDRSYTTLNLFSSDHNTSVSISGTLDVLQLSTHSPTRLEGTLSREAGTMGDLTFSMDLAFSADVEDYQAPVKGAVKSGAEAQALASVAAYLAMRKAVRAADLESIRKLPRYPQDFEGADGLKFVKIMQSEEPADIEVVEAAEGPEVATLTITGTLEGRPIRRTFDMQKKDGRWTTNNDNWEAN